MNKIYIVFEEPSDPWAGGPWIKIIFLTEEEANKYVEDYNKDKKYRWEKYFVEEYEIGQYYL